MSDGLKLLAETEEGLEVLSAAMQDAIVRVDGVHFDKMAQTLTLNMSRYCHDLGDGKRVKSGLLLNNVLSLRGKGIDRSDPEAYLVLLSMSFQVGSKPPTGDLTLVFAGGGELLAKVDYIEARLVDYLGARTTQSLPIHPD